MGMLGTVMNNLALQDFLEEHRCESDRDHHGPGGQYLPLRAVRHLEKDGW